MDVSAVISYLFPTAVLNTDYTVIDEGNGIGQQLGSWNTALGAQPSQQTLLTTWTNTVELSTAKNLQMQNLRTQCRSTIVAGFTSSALGASYHYPFNNTPESPDQLNIASAVLAAFINANTTGWVIPIWVRDSSNQWVFMDHTAPQVQQVGVDSKTFVVTNQTKLNNLITQINAATTVAAVQAIVW